MGNVLSSHSSDSYLSPQGWLTRNAVLGSRLLQDPTVCAAVDAVKQEVLDAAGGASMDRISLRMSSVLLPL